MHYSCCKNWSCWSHHTLFTPLLKHQVWWRRLDVVANVISLRTLHQEISRSTAKLSTSQTGFEVLTAVSMKIAVFWVVAPCKDLWNVGKLLPDYTVLQPRRQQSSTSQTIVFHNQLPTVECFWGANSHSVGQEILCFHCTRKFITMFTIARNWISSWASLIYSTKYILLLYYHLCLYLKYYFTFRFSNLVFSFFVLEQGKQKHKMQQFFKEIGSKVLELPSCQQTTENS
jgi:hypothetical protein